MRLTITRPDDWHLHVRDGAHMRAVVPHTARRFGRAMIMPNLKQPVTTVEMASAYRERIRMAMPADAAFEPLMTLYLTDNTRPEEIVAAKRSGFVHGVKYYPAGATTNADSGVTDLAKCHDVFAAMEEENLPLQVHGEVTFPEVDIFDRERVFIDRLLIPLLQKFSKLRVVLEHITTQQAVRFVKATPPRVAATITAHHLLLNRNALFAGGMRPHHYCLPVLKREEHRRALIEAAIGGSAKFFLGTDSAPHAQNEKESACGCAGIFTAHAGIELYAEIFGANDALDKLEAFASVHGAQFYGLPRNADKITLVKEEWSVLPSLQFGADFLVPFRAGGTVAWKVV